MSYDSVILATAGLVAYWKIEELVPPPPTPNLNLIDTFAANNGSLIPTGEGGNILTLGLTGPIITDSPSYGASGAIGRIPNSGGVDGGPLQLTGAQTWECWAKKTGVGVQIMMNGGSGATTDTYLSWGEVGTGLFVDNALFALDWGSGVNRGITSCALDDDVWYHVAGTYDGVDTMKLYVMGWLVASRSDCPAAPTNPSGSSQPWRLGYISSVLGAIDRSAGLSHVAIYSGELSQTVLRTHVVAALGSLPDNPCGDTPTVSVGCPGAIGVVGELYASEVTVIGGTPPYTFAIISGALPDGLTLDANTGAITGTPTVGGSFNFTVQVTDADLNTGESPDCQIVIADSPPPPPNPPMARTMRFDAGIGSAYYLIPQLSDSSNELRSKNVKAVHVTGKRTNASIMGYAYDVNQPINMDDLEAGVRTNVRNITRPQPLVDCAHVEQSERKQINIVGTLHTVRLMGNDAGEDVRDRYEEIVVEVSDQGVRR